MDIKFSFVDILSILALILGLLYNFQILTLKNRTKAIRFFSFCILNITFIILFFFMLRMEMSKYIKYATPLLIVSQLILPINLWIYLKKIIINQDDNKNFRHYLFPITSGIVVLILLLLVVFIPNVETKKFTLKILTLSVWMLMTVAFLVLNAIYLTFALLLLKRHQRNIRNYYSYTQKIDLQWVKVMIFGYLFLLIGLVACSFIDDSDVSDMVFYGVLISYIVYIGHNALRQKDIWSEQKMGMNELLNFEPELKSPTDTIENEQYTESQLALFKELKEKLIQLMELEKPYLDQDLSILKLAKDLNTNTKYLSHIINSEFNQNFINFINEYRIQEVKENLLKHNLHFTIEALGQNAGFKSKSSFNAAFKKSTGLTPSAFMKQQVQAENVA